MNTRRRNRKLAPVDDGIIQIAVRCEPHAHDIGHGLAAQRRRKDKAEYLCQESNDTAITVSHFCDPKLKSLLKAVSATNSDKH